MSTLLILLSRNSGVIFDSSLSLLWRIRWARSAKLHVLKTEELDLSGGTLKPQRPWTPPVICRLDYVNSLFTSVPQKHPDEFQVTNGAARLFCRASKREHIRPLLADLHWLPVSHRIVYKIATYCILSCDLGFCASVSSWSSSAVHSPPPPPPRSAGWSIFRIPIRRKKFQRQRAFS